MNLKKHFLYFVLISMVFSCKNPSTQVPASIDIHAEISIDEIQESLRNGTYTITQLTEFYLDRIQKFSFSGPQLNAIITLNPDALEIAQQLDEELKKGEIRGPLHGIPLVLKDNIDTGDKMPCTVGAIAMKNSFPLEDSPLARQLREAGAVILGKANLSEWANFHSTFSSSGWSALGGQTRNPYDLSRNPCGSSSGSAVAVAANLSVLAIGTETNGSIVCPSNNNGIVGIKPTVGLISRTGIIPISFTQDTGGPMARTIRDAAICLGALTEIDSADSKTLNPERKAFKDYTQFLKRDGMKGKRIGYWKSNIESHFRLEKIMDNAVETFKDAGATIVEIEQIISSNAQGNSFKLLLYEFKEGLNQYFTKLGPEAEIKSLNELVEKTLADSVEMHYFDHSLLERSLEMGGLDDAEYKEALEIAIKGSRENGIDKIMKEHDLDAIIAPSGSPAWTTDLVNGDHFGVYSSSPAAIAGYPSITVPMGNIDGLPVGLSIFGAAWTEDILLEIAYSFEQTSKARISPTYSQYLPSE